MRRNFGASSDADMLALLIRDLREQIRRARVAARKGPRTMRVGSWRVVEDPESGELVAVHADGRRRVLTGGDDGR